MLPQRRYVRIYETMRRHVAEGEHRHTGMCVTTRSATAGRSTSLSCLVKKGVHTRRHSGRLHAQCDKQNVAVGYVALLLRIRGGRRFNYEPAGEAS